ncbi:alpha carbonic anhydrase 1 chloroplastic [Prunus yedoensis var. nudiflora]|uniref:Carbonic anhydrase n=1 Tax=Prunus yedoensis var. nudiflora TaxID=2094558 RepID=A0A314XYU7_PRUYE|nr:alpha carbonic anhydrase 1 chloroplastic [Prunus yedoensis var. nudiflora]
MRVSLKLAAKVCVCSRVDKAIAIMALRICFLFLVIALLLAISTSTCVQNVSFSYSGATGPENWGSLSPNFSACSNGKIQSPVDIVKGILTTDKRLKPLTRVYGASNATLFNNGFNLGVQFEGHVGTLDVDGKNYDLKQMHWHSPSEHRLNGVQFPAELHLVHQASDGSVSVVSVLFQFGKDDILISKIKDKLTELAQETCKKEEDGHIPLGTVDINEFQKKSRKYFRYVGSLTVPPCTENVVWNILGKVRTISQDQLNALKAPLDSDCKNNSRPLQPPNGRKVELYDERRDQ